MADEFNKDDETRPATMEEIEATFNSKEYAEISAMVDEVQKERERMNLIPYNKEAERYILDRYPVRSLYARADIKDFAESNFDTYLTEDEIQAVGDEFLSNYPDEIYLAIVDAIKQVISERE
jgi:hypothetical protein